MTGAAFTDAFTPQSPAAVKGDPAATGNPASTGDQAVTENPASRATVGGPPQPSPALPLGDWQFWVVTAIALVAAAALLRAIWPRNRRGATQRATLTIGGRVPDKDH